ncbi:PAS domain-containing protein [uncultured Sphaerotilus sp.]|uniref:PAS domain-containing protein n=1 Tax=uncultured Sphaerotilus sp. TaxID=474984 RepID=UPI0030CA153C
MPQHTIELDRQHALRTQALSRLTGNSASTGTRSNASVALGVLHQLASSPSTAADALALLHELQVHQMEVDLQDEELHRSRAELEADLLRLTQCHDHAPVGCFTIDRGTVLCEVNLTGARLLGVEREALTGRTLNAFLTPPSADALQALLGQVDVSLGDGHHGDDPATCTLELITRDGRRRHVDASAAADPVGGRYLLALSSSRDHSLRTTP